MCISNVIVHICQQFARDFFHMVLINWSTKFQTLSLRVFLPEWAFDQCIALWTQHRHSTLHQQQQNREHLCSVSSSRPEIYFCSLFHNRKAKQLNPERPRPIYHTLRSYAPTNLCLQCWKVSSLIGARRYRRSCSTWHSDWADAQISRGGNKTLHISGLPLRLCQLQSFLCSLIPLCHSGVCQSFVTLCSCQFEIPVQIWPQAVQPFLNLCPTCNGAPSELWMLTFQTRGLCLCCATLVKSARVCLWGKWGKWRSHTADHHVPSNHISWNGQAEINQTAKLIRSVRKHFNETIKWIWRQANISHTDAKKVWFVLLPLLSFDFLTSYWLCWSNQAAEKWITSAASQM